MAVLNYTIQTSKEHEVMNEFRSGVTKVPALKMCMCQIKPVSSI